MKDPWPFSLADSLKLHTPSRTTKFRFPYFNYYIVRLFLRDGDALRAQGRRPQLHSKPAKKAQFKVLLSSVEQVCSSNRKPFRGDRRRRRRRRRCLLLMLFFFFSFPLFGASITW